MYAFTAVLVIGISIFFFIAEKRQTQLIIEAYTNEIGADLKLSENDSIELSYYKAQTQMNNKLIGYSSRSIVAASTLKYTAFLIGMVMVFLGSIMIIRGIRTAPSEIEGDFKENVKFKVLSSSPGVIISFLGAAILITAILKDSGVDLTNFQVKQYGEIGINPLDEKPEGDTTSASTGLGGFIGGKVKIDSLKSN